MPTTLKVLGQADPAATTETDLATASGGESLLVSSIVVANREATGTTIRLSVSVGGGSTQDMDYLAYDAPIEGNDVIVYTVGLGMAPSDVLRCWAADTGVSFNVMGQAQT